MSNNVKKIDISSEECSASVRENETAVKSASSSADSSVIISNNDTQIDLSSASCSIYIHEFETFDDIAQNCLENIPKPENSTQINVSNIESFVQDNMLSNESRTDSVKVEKCINKSNSINNDIEITNESRDSEVNLSGSEGNFQSEEIPVYNKNIPYYELLYNWLYYSPSASGFLCKACSLVYSSTNTPWVNIGINFKQGGHPTRTIKKHENSKKHKQAITIAQNTSKNIFESISEGAEIAKKSKSNFNRQILSKYIKILYFMIKKQCAVSENFESIIRFLGDELGDKEISQHLHTCGKNATYLSHISVENLLSAISTYIEQKTLTEIGCSDFFAMLADESTDESQREQLGILVRYKLRGDNTVKEKYLGLVNLISTTAEAIMKAIEKITIAKTIELSNCLFLALDGTNVMSGEISGVQRRMKQHSPHCIYINCRNHRLALVFAHLLKKYDILKAVDSLLISLWKLFHYSPKKAHVFREIQENVYHENVLKMIKVSVTRWLSHGRACERVSLRFKELVETLDSLFSETKDPELKGLREQLLDRNIILAILFLADFLTRVDKLNQWLQSPFISFSLIGVKVENLIEEIDEYCSKLENGTHFHKSKELITLSNECTSLSLKIRNRSHHKENQDIVTEFKENFVNNFVKDFKTELSNAFEMNNDQNVLKGFDFFNDFNVEQLLDINEDQEKSNKKATCLSLLISHYGEEKSDTFQNVTNISSPIIDKISIRNEKEGFEKEISYAQMTYDIEKTQKARDFLLHGENENAKKIMDMKITSSELLNLLERDSKNWILYPNFMKLLTLCIIIPSSTASVERLFSRMNLVCTELRTRLKQETLDQQLRIIINGPSTLSNQDCEAIIDIFKSGGNRRLLL